ncbi:ferredoxin family protein [Candidatus Sumerlaeota bacterium]|nr:ferredoxin family protein [Candidatus Sumerlaeota bacterium]
MTYVVTEACIACKYTDCVSVCPVSCFHEGENFLVINPDECIDCCACEPECPTQAICADSDIPDNQAHCLEINAVFSGAKDPSEADTTGWSPHLVEAIKSADFEVWPKIEEQKDALDGADEAAKREGKAGELSPKPFKG